ncbi:hypothetical protein ANN_25057 [Periplaneta americana]|uniref:Uncharacterized protein n=1 Tax=Periplaneta americana TaxID=6978 RepID=A0ABQ8S0M4_PERAM|nr:hypothetical protein ANN_25057 [Periplaneta americana]
MWLADYLEKLLSKYGVHSEEYVPIRTIMSRNYIKVDDIRVSEKINTFGCFGAIRHDPQSLLDLGAISTSLPVMWFLFCLPYDVYYVWVVTVFLCYVFDCVHFFIVVFLAHGGRNVNCFETCTEVTFFLLFVDINFDGQHEHGAFDLRCGMLPYATDDNKYLRTTCPRKTQFERGYGSTQTLQTAIYCYDVQVIPYTFSSSD